MPKIKCTQIIIRSNFGARVFWGKWPSNTIITAWLSDIRLYTRCRWFSFWKLFFTAELNVGHRIPHWWLWLLRFNNSNTDCIAVARQAKPHETSAGQITKWAAQARSLTSPPFYDAISGPVACTVLALVSTFAPQFSKCWPLKPAHAYGQQWSSVRRPAGV